MTSYTLNKLKSEIEQLKTQRAELLEALVGIMDISEDVLQGFLCESEIIAARKAIAKAKGEV